MSTATPARLRTPGTPGSPRAPRTPGTTERRAWVEQVMGMPISVHVRGAGARGPAADTAVQAVLSDLRWADAVFSTYRPGSQISRLQRGELDLAAAAPEVRQVHTLCTEALDRTGGAFDAWSAVPGRPGVFDPTGLVKSWAVERAARHLDGLRDVAVAVGAGGDVLLRTGPAAPDPWVVGIEDPRERGTVLASVPVHDGGVATSGVAARGQHIVDPRTGTPATAVLSATVIGPSLLWADVYATAAVVLGEHAVAWTATLPGTSGLLVLADGSTHRWGNPA